MYVTSKCVDIKMCKLQNDLDFLKVLFHSSIFENQHLGRYSQCWLVLK